MSRAAIYSALTSNSDLIAIGFDNAHILANYSQDQRPDISLTTDTPMFIIIRYGTPQLGIRYQGPRFIGTWNFDIWVHMAKEFSSDFTRIDDVIEICDVALTSIVDVDGADGYTATLITSAGRSGDFEDKVFETFCKSASYSMVSHKTEAGE